MAYDTDEEQIEAIKNWWRENGTSLLVGVVVVVVGVFGWRQWDSSRENSAREASELYQRIAEIAPANPGVQITEEDRRQAAELNDRLREEYEGTIYPRFSALFMAKLHMDAGDLESAENQLNWILDNRELGFLRSADEELFVTARLRLARVKLAQGEAREALTLLEAEQPGSFAALYAEARGDAYLALGQRAEARQAYEAASADGGNPLVELKLRDLGSVDANS